MSAEAMCSPRRWGETAKKFEGQMRLDLQVLLRLAADAALEVLELAARLGDLGGRQSAHGKDETVAVILLDLPVLVMQILELIVPEGAIRFLIGQIDNIMAKLVF